jgi:hypothetical protein
MSFPVGMMLSLPLRLGLDDDRTGFDNREIRRAIIRQANPLTNASGTLNFFVQLHRPILGADDDLLTVVQLHLFSAAWLRDDLHHGVQIDRVFDVFR